MAQTRSSQEKDIYRPEPATLAKVQPVTEMESFFELRLDSGKELGHMPGQFVEVSVAGIGEAPFGVSSSPTRQGSFHLLLRRVGNVSSALHRLKAGDKVGIRGPFGKPFPVDDAMKGQDILFISGGIGLVPVRSVIQYVFDHRRDYGAVTILFGTKSPADRLFVDETDEWKRQPDTVYLESVDRADASWKGNVGVITTLMPKITIDPVRTVAVICGPPIMYKFVLMELNKMGVPSERSYVSLERHMKCGVGKCGHCQINGLYACQDGPVFRYSDLIPVREAFR
ncbi:MAG: FAD/NAD(P)-binding protein [Verrucomicrobia bacterium]|nr:FAD/NAD(P)-binding protein [Verrucomicrobiota bacterium]MCG2680561.1 FAD/NAD(P)-binding protein [Kiritimatiellia bacterium]MBU4246879.1 FAD/NAD(P)-binding protein [Verrucomicrobiota bacterium]MBU4290842.1 FAD/NAD(P)-binding protein [Verrucomicrobiota bacterium]MBU4429251.1 FAD/NAD(P)-binding protein [Verrucomicrobiota bacterium]